MTNITTQTNIDRLSVNFQGNEGNNFSINPSISADSRYIAFESAANNLVKRSIIITTLVIAHIPLMLVEGIFTAMIVSFLPKFKPELLPEKVR